LLYLVQTKMTTQMPGLAEHEELQETAHAELVGLPRMAEVRLQQQHPAGFDDDEEEEEHVKLRMVAETCLLHLSLPLPLPLLLQQTGHAEDEFQRTVPMGVTEA
jgi:hypothetical protein